MKKIDIRKITIGDGTTKICYPITGATPELVLSEAAQMKSEPCDLIEWRIDFFNDANDEGKVISLLPKLRDAIGDKPILFVYRTSNDGGLKEPDEEYYFRLNKGAIDSGMVDIVDIELETNPDGISEIREYAHRHGVKLLISKHDFSGTPEDCDMEAIFRRINEKGADICKLAVMARQEGDADRVSGVAKKLCSEPSQMPMIAVAMGELGQSTRRLKPFSGSSITYARGSNSVSPGQLTIKELLED